MRQVFLLGVVFSIGLSAAHSFAAPPDQPEFDAAQLEFFEKSVRPILVARCYECHSSKLEEPEGSLRLDSLAGILQGGDTSPAAVPGDPKKSLLIDAINHGSNKMPPKSKLPAEEIATLTKWVEQGLPWPKEAIPVAAKKIQFDLAARKQQHWAWQPIQSPPLPTVKNQAWPKAATDRFVLAKMETQGLSPAAPADRATLLRRIYFDLIGLPPAPNEVEAFVKDESPSAVEAVVDRLLATPQFGERWARHWLDLVRYAESRGHEFDYPLANAFQYRDYVIRALNADIPYRDFVTEHIAGDLLAKPRANPETGANESILGTGFWFLGEWIHSPVDIRKDETDRHDNMIDVMGKTFLGLTIGCARCHDHKFDAISQADYHALLGFTHSSSYRQAAFESDIPNRKIAAALQTQRTAARKLASRETAAALRPGIAQVAAYLAAAHDATTQKKPVAELAAELKLDEKRLQAWVAELDAAEKDSRHLLNLWTKLKNAADAGTRSAVVAALVSGQADAAKLAETGANSPHVVVDYRNPRPGDFLPDGFLFVNGPEPLGTLQLDPSAPFPVAGLITRGTVRCDPAFSGLADAPKNERDTGAVGGIPRSGRTFNSKTFTIENGFVHCLVAGEGWVYASVDSHHLVNGPLHGQLVRSFNHKDKAQWFSLNLQAYVGHRVHLEFTPKDEPSFAVLAIAQGQQPPEGLLGTPLSYPKELFDAAVKSSIDLATAYQAWLAESLNKLETQKFSEGAADTNFAIVADWLIRRRELFLADASLDLSAELKTQLDALKKLAGEVRKTSATAPTACDGSGVDDPLLKRGNARTPGDAIPRRFLEALDGPAPLKIAHGSGRLELAQRILDPKNPLTSRVIVNRVWQHLFGRGIVATVDNFGVLGERPSNPELLDHLATEFTRDGGSIKRLIRRLVLSSAYQQSSQPTEKAEQVDPQNILLSHANLRRLEGEAIRDAILASTGQLKNTSFGPSTPIFLTRYLDGRGRPASGPLDGAGRRSIYLSIRRNFLSPFLMVFDTPIPFSTNGRRNVSNVPAQALTLLNDPFLLEQAKIWGTRLAKQRERSANERVSEMYQTAFSRVPTPDELTAAAEFLHDQGQEYQLAADAAQSDPRVWSDLAHVLFNTKEFIYIR